MIYLDNAATTKPSRRAIRIAKESLEEYWMNPSAIYNGATEVSNKIKKSRQIIADLINFKPSQITFTSGATEGNNMVLNQNWDYIITDRIEHDSVYNTALSMSDKVRFIDVDDTGKIDLNQLKDTIKECKGNILVSIMSVNNEIGTIQPYKEIAEICNSISGVTYHMDATQSIGKIPIPYSFADIITASAHKFHGVKGIGFLASKKNLDSFIKGGHQESGIRAGTENVMGIISMAEALEESHTGILNKLEYVRNLNNHLCNRLTHEISDIRINSDKNNPYILNVSFKNVNAESLLHLLSLKGIYVSSGSACNSRDTKVSRILQQINVPEDYIYGSIRFSFSTENTIEEMDIVADTINDSIKMLKKLKGDKND